MKNILRRVLGFMLGFAMGLTFVVVPVLALTPLQHEMAASLQPAPIAPPPIHNTTTAQPVSDTTTVQPHTLSPAIRTAIQKKVAEAAAADTATTDDSKKKSWFQTLFSDWGVQFLALVVSLIGVILAVSGFSLAGAKKKKHMSTFMNDIDDAFHSFKWKSKRCEAELYRLHDLMEEKLKQGKLDESSYGLLSGRIEKYLKEIHELDSLPEDVRKKRAGD